MAQQINDMSNEAIDWSREAMAYLRELNKGVGPAQQGKNWAQLRSYINYEISKIGMQGSAKSA